MLLYGSPATFHDTKTRDMPKRILIHVRYNTPRLTADALALGSRQCQWAARETAARPDADPPDPPASCSHPRATPHRSPKASIAPFIILMKVSVDGLALRGGSGSRGG